MSKNDNFLFLNNKRVSDIRELRENFDTAVLVGYYLGGGLMKWLKSVGEEGILNRVNEINPNYDISEQLEFAFGVRPDKKAPKIMGVLKPSPVSERKEPPKKPFVPNFRDSNGSFSSSFLASSFLTGSFTSSFTALSNTSYKGIFTGSFSTFFSTSFNTPFLLSGSFGGLSGSFLSGSFNGSFPGGYLNSEGSFVIKLGNSEVTETEYKKTMIILSSCPLNQYGYGINLI